MKTVSHSLRNRAGGIAAGWTLAMFLCHGTAECGELRQYELPSQSPRMIQPYQQQQQVQKRPTVDESVYRRFREYIQPLNRTKKGALQRNYTQRLKKAEEGSRWEEAEYYRRLLEILAASQR